MILYHGTNSDFSEIDLKKTKPYKDFGRGFYVTDIQRQAYELAENRSRIFGGNPVVQEYEFDESIFQSNQLRLLRFEKVCVEWAEFIYKNRSSSAKFTHNYDIVVGPIADDGVAYLLNMYEDGLRTLEELAKELEYKDLNSQYCFLTEKAVSLLRRVK
ncbi:DUF3990 domain-containing protein [uncultured Fibrobacter sp.]|uniref:DUF3990 domain-containing protein n=1 Tax=uncultured Fibrobacter sp. TaxID=261512 RepID=UPI0025F36D40|nr:DUF3990 domain-containing protein [uncultured Fibrobacter sp.]